MKIEIEVLKHNDPLTKAYLKLVQRHLTSLKKSKETKSVEMDFSPSKKEYIESFCKEYGVTEDVIITAEFFLMSDAV